MRMLTYPHTGTKQYDSSLTAIIFSNKLPLTFTILCVDVFVIVFSLVCEQSYAHVLSKWYPEILMHLPGKILIHHYCNCECCLCSIADKPIILVGAKLDMRDDKHVITYMKQKGESLAMTHVELTSWYFRRNSNYI
jgi:GTPase SAR1 family protein